MNKKKNNKPEKKFASNIAISFFFAAIFVLIFYYFIDDEVSFYVSLINTTAVRNTSSSNQEITYNLEAKRLIKYPSWGSKYATLVISSINLKLPVYHGDSLKLLRYGIGHYAGSYFPGENGSIILAGHNNVGYFHELDKVKIGDKVTIETIYGTFHYQVDDTKIVHETDLSAFPIQHDEERLIMYTCWPINKRVVGRKTKRYVVYAHKVGDLNEK